jgi:hypothetical protein
MSCLSLSFAVVGGLAFLGWFSLSWRDHVPFPGSDLLWYVPSAVSIALGVWTGRTRRVWPDSSFVAIASGATGIVIGLVALFFGPVRILD